MALPNDYARQHCSLARALEVVGERWTLLIVRDAFYGVRRFTDFAAHLDIPRAVLAARLSALVDADVLERTDGPTGEYVLTDAGIDLWPVLWSLLQWGARHASDGRPTRTFAHAGCGRTLDRDARCPRCGTTPAPSDVTVAPAPDTPVTRNDPVTRALAAPHRLLTPLSGAPHATTVPAETGAAAVGP